MRNRDAAIRLEAESIFRDILASVELDPRFQDAVTKSRLVGVYTPFLPIVLDLWPTLRESEFMERRLLFSYS